MVTPAQYGWTRMARFGVETGEPPGGSAAVARLLPVDTVCNQIIDVPSEEG